MIIGIGVDLLNCGRLERALLNHEIRFLERIATPLEIQRLHEKFPDLPLVKTYYENKKFLTAIGKIFAAKEAASKALGTGFRAGITFHSFEVLRNEIGKPEITVEPQLEKRLTEKFSAPFQFHLSITDEWPFVEAFVVLEKP